MPKATAPPIPRPEPLFSLDLVENGGTFAPKTLDEASSWIQVETAFWAWIRNQNFGNHDQGLKQALEQLNQALNHAQQVPQYRHSNPQQYQSQISAVDNIARNVYVQPPSPLDSTDAAERVLMVRPYLSLLDLQALFRPATDGIVKDEGTPFSLAEVLTRQGKP